MTQDGNSALFLYQHENSLTFAL